MKISADLFAALGEPNRLRIVECLRAGPRQVKEIRGRLLLRQSQVSQHLKVLKEVGLVELESQENHRYYRLRVRSLRQLGKWFDRYRPILEDRFDPRGEVARSSSVGRSTAQAFPSKTRVRRR